MNAPELIDPRPAVTALLSELESQHAHAWAFVCECDRLDCDERVTLSADEYEALRARGGLVLSRLAACVST